MTIHLKQGEHRRRADGMCAMEAAAYIAGEKHSDHPACVSPVIATFVRSWNDGLPSDADRDRLLKPLLPVILHTRTTEADEETRAWMATDWLVRVQAPAWLDLAGLGDCAAALRGLEPVLTAGAWGRAKPTVDAARAAARDAAWDAARDAAWDAARDAAWDAARAAAMAAARDAARAAARAAAWDAAWDAARDAARDAAWDAARDAAWERLAPTVARLQKSACDLIRQMAAVGVQHEPRYSAERYAEVCA